MPILNVELPIVACYAVVPWLIVLFHFNLILQLYLLSRCIHQFNHATAGMLDSRARMEQQIRLFPFPFVQMLIPTEESRVTRVFFSAIVWVAIIWLPLALIVAAQVSYLPYHDVSATQWMRLAVSLDVASLLLLKLRYADLRNLSGSPRSGSKAEGLEELATRLDVLGWKPTMYHDASLAAAASGDPIQQSARDDAVFLDKNVLCDEHAIELFAPKISGCHTSDELAEYPDGVADEACKDRNIAAGLVYRLVKSKAGKLKPSRRKPTQAERNRVKRFDEYTRLLASKLAAPGCEAVGSLGRLKSELRSILADYSLGGGSALAPRPLDEAFDLCPHGH